MKKQRLKYVLFLLLFIAAASMVHAQSANSYAFSIQQAVDYAKKNNAQVKNALLGIQVQEQINRGIASAAYPSISGNVSLTDYIEVPTQVIPGDFVGQPGTTKPVKFGVKYNSSALLQAQQLLFDGQLFVGLQARKTSIEFAKKNVEVTEDAIKVNIYKIYYQLVVSKTQIELLDANIVRLEKLK
ncbi:MAG: TolC family protein, partial [Chitinophagaceae bacterium]|nr:TolC family protein [Chitinophagaceae bacterium]